MQIDVVIVAGRRPDLLSKTLDSFSDRLFRHFDLQRIICNIDPIFGSVEDAQACAEIVARAHSHTKIFTPETKGYTEAVARVWAESTAPIFLHLEDDWLLNRDVKPSEIHAFEDPTVGQICFNHANKNWDKKKGEYCYGRRRYKIGNIATPFKWKHPVFTVSPTFVRGDFGRHCATLLDPLFDPEKQFFKAVNPRLEEYVFSFKKRY